jgi:predicted MFS family arabinose efflux permease
VTRPLRDYRIRCWLAGEGLSAFGDQCTSVALTVTAIRVLGPAAAGPVLATIGLPRFVLPLLGGLLADRLDPRRMLLVCHVVRAAALLALAAAWSTRSGAWPLLATTLLLGVGASLADPASRSLAPRLVARAELIRITSARSAAARFAAVLGAPTGGLLLSVAGVRVVLALDAATFAVAAALLAPMPRLAPGRPGRRGGMLGDIGHGLRHAVGHPVAGPALVLLAAVNLAVCGPAQLGITELAQTSRWQPWVVGVLFGAFGAGGAAGAILLTGAGHRTRRSGALAVAAAATAAACLLAMAAAPTFPVLLPVMAILGTSAVAANILATLVQHAMPPELAGRTAGLLTLTIWGSWSLSIAGTGPALRLLGPRPALLVTAATLAALTTLLACRHRALLTASWHPAC